MNIASTGKTTVGVSVNYLAETGLISLGNDVNNFIPSRINNPQTKKSTIKLRWLLENYLSKMVCTIQIKL